MATKINPKSSLIYFIALIILSASLLVAFYRPANSNEKNNLRPMDNFHKKIKAIVQMLYAQRPTADRIAEVLGGKIYRTETSKHWYITGNGFQAVIPAVDLAARGTVSEVIIYPEKELGIDLQHIELILGQWKKIHESKTTSIRFDYPDSQSDDKVTIYIEMSFPPRIPNSSILHILIRSQKTR